MRRSPQPGTVPAVQVGSPAGSIATSAARRAAVDAAPPQVASLAWFRVGGVTAGSAAAAAGIAALAGHPWWATTAAIGGGGLAASAARAGLRSRRRSRRIARAITEVGPAVSERQLPAMALSGLVKVRWPAKGDRPKRVTVCPPASCDLTDAARIDQIAAAAGRGLGVRLEPMRVRRRRHELDLIPSKVDRSTEQDVDLRRSEMVVSQRLDGRIVDPIFRADGAGELESFEIHYRPTIRTSTPRFWAGFDSAFNSQMPGRWRVRADTVADVAHVRRRPTMPTRVPYDLSVLEECGRREIPYGVDEDGRLVVWPLDISPHMLISGTTGGGKTAAMRVVIRGWLGRGWPVVISDVKLVEYLGICDWPGVRFLATEDHEIVAAFASTDAEMRARYRQIKAGKVHEDDLTPWLLVIDEYRETQETLGDWWKTKAWDGDGKKPTDPPVVAKVPSIGRLGRTAGMHLLIGIQRPDVDKTFLTGEMRNNFRCRLSMATLTVEEARMMWGDASIGRSVPPNVKGRGTGMTVDGVAGEIQVFWLPDPRRAIRGTDDWELAESLRPESSEWSFQTLQDGELVDTDETPATPWRQLAERTARRDGSAEDDGGRPAVEGAWDEAPGGEHAEWDSKYDDPAQVPAADVGEADLIAVDDHGSTWAVVESVGEDPTDPDQLFIDARVVDTGEPHTVMVSAEEAIDCRRQLEEWGDPQ